MTPPRKTLDLGQRIPDGALVRLPTDVVTETVAILGRRGSGKTNTGKRIAEGLLNAQQQVVILDPLDVWWGLKTGADGNADQGHPILVVGDDRKPHTDLPLRADDGQVLADLVVDHRLPVILSLRHLSKTKAKAFVADFAERIYERKGDPTCATPCCFVIDEASTIVPQKLPSQDINAARMVGAIESWVRQGRSSGIGCVLIDQRPASVNKDVLTQVEVLLCHQLVHKLDRKAVLEWVEANDPDDHRKVFMDSLAGLQRGEAWLWSPGWLQTFERVNVHLADTYDSSRTPAAGDATSVPTTLATLDLDAVRDLLSDAVEQADQNNPAKLRQRIAALENDLKRARATAVDEDRADRDKAINLAYRNGYTDAVELYETLKADALRDAGIVLDTADTARLQLDTQLRIVESALADLRAGLTHALSPKEPTHDSPPPKTPLRVAEGGRRSRPDTGTRRPEPAAGQAAATHPPRPARKPTLPKLPPADTPDWFRPSHQRILDAIAWCESVNLDQPDRSLVAVVAGSKSKKSSSFKNDVSRLSANGYLSYPGSDRLALEPAGRSLAQAPDAPPTLAEYQEAWRQCRAFRPAHVRILDVVIGAHPHELTRDELAEMASTTTTSSSFKNDVSRLSSIGLIRYPGPSQIAATTLLFPEGLQ